MSPEIVTKEMLGSPSFSSETVGMEPDFGDLQTTPEEQETTEELGPTIRTVDPSQSAPKFKYKDQAEAEKAYLEAVRKMTEATERSSRYEKMIQSLTQQTKPTEPQESVARRLAKEALANIKKLDDQDSNYQEKVAIIWAEAQEKIADTKYGEHYRQEQDYTHATTGAESMAKEAGLTSPMAIEAFWMVANNAPKGIPFEQQVQWSIDQVKQFIEEIKNEAAGKATDTAIEKRNLAVLKKGGKAPSTSTIEEDLPEQASTADAVKRALRARRVRD